jgi:hypothetical protein
VVEFVEAAEELRSGGSDDLMSASDALIKRFLDAGLKRLRNKSG